MFVNNILIKARDLGSDSLQNTLVFGILSLTYIIRKSGHSLQNSLWKLSGFPRRGANTPVEGGVN